jgi:acetyl-CoA synthetase
MLAADSRRLLHGRRARKDKDRYFWIMGRVDDVLKISGHHWSTMEVESALSRTKRLPKPPWLAA